MGNTKIPVFLVIALSACTGGQPSDSLVTRTDSAGLSIVENLGGERPLAWTFERVLSLGGADSGAESFFQIVEEGLALGSGGLIFILDVGNRQVHTFDSDGAHVSTFGNEGEGPGEFYYPASLILSETGEIVIFDARRRSLLSFTRDGVFSDEGPGPRSFLGGTTRLFGDTILYWRRSTDRETRARTFFLTVATPRDTADLVTFPLPAASDVSYEECGILNMSLPPLFADPPKWDSRNRVTAISGPPEYDLRIFRGGKETMRVRRDIEPAEATLDRAVEYLGEGVKWTIGGGRECWVSPETVLEKRGVASHIPLVADVAVSPEGWIWVRRNVPGSRGGPIDVFDETGAYLGTLPSDFPWPAAFGVGDQVLSLEEDELDIQRVVLYRIHRG